MSSNNQSIGRVNIKSPTERIILILCIIIFIIIIMLIIVTYCFMSYYDITLDNNIKYTSIN